jgi:hypothetical protein
VLDFVSDYVGFRHIILIPVMQLILVLAVFRRSFWNISTLLFGVMNFFLIYMFLVIVGSSSYGNDANLIPVISSYAIQFFPFCAVGIVILIVFAICRTIKVKIFTMILAFFSIILSFLSFFLIWGVLGDAADCEKLGTEKEKRICKQSW